MASVGGKMALGWQVICGGLCIPQLELPQSALVAMHMSLHWDSKKKKDQESEPQRLMYPPTPTPYPPICA